jgi:MFS family permease
MAEMALEDRQIKKTALLCWLGWVFDFYDLILIAFLLNGIKSTLGVAESETHWLMGVGLAASGLGGILFGDLADRFGRKKILTVTVVLFSLGMFLTSFVQTFDQFLITRFITGLGLGGEWAVGHALIAESVPPEKRARWSAFIQCGEPVGVALAVIVGFFILPTLGWDWRMAFLVSSLTGLLALFFRAHLKESPIWESLPKKSISERFAEIFPFLKKFWPIMLLAYVLAFFKLGTYWTCYTWLPQFIEKTTKEAIQHSVPWLLCGQVGQFIGMLAFGRIADTVGRRVAFTIFSVITAAALTPMALLWNEILGQPIFWMLMFVMGFGSGCTAGFGALLSELFPNAFRTFAMGVTYNLARGAQLFALWLVSVIVVDHGIFGGLMVPVTLALLTAMWVWTLPDRKGVSLSDISEN